MTGLAADVVAKSTPVAGCEPGQASRGDLSGSAEAGECDRRAQTGRSRCARRMTQQRMTGETLVCSSDPAGSRGGGGEYRTAGGRGFGEGREEGGTLIQSTMCKLRKMWSRHNKMEECDMIISFIEHMGW